MLWSLPLSVIVLCWSHVSSADAIPQRQENPSSPHEGTPRQAYNKIAPKVMILNMVSRLQYTR